MKKQKGNDKIEMPTEYQTINCISENFFDRNFWNIVDKDPQQLPSKANKAISWIELLYGEKTSKIDKNPTIKTNHLPFDCFSLKIKKAKILIILGLK